MRLSVARHADLMEERLKEHEDKGGWEDCTFTFLIGELKMHIDDLEYTLFEQGPKGYIENECADISNFAMMIADNFNLSREER